ncbi:MAG TPA: glycosyltransferase family 87 protein [Candidatus Dormibacteraeota bacterium]|nr:glycosyltransferase family 87 protein [Candidatus Dormibacteraeota bacterium]
MTAVRRFGVPLALVVVLIAIAVDFWNPSEPIGIDFHTYEAAARVGVQDGWSHIYDQSLVAAAQKELVPGQIAQPFLSPPPTAWLAALLVPLPYWPSYYLWATFTLVAFALALLWSSSDRGLVRWVGAAAVLTPWWVLHAVHLGQVVPLVAAGVVLSWRFAREHREVAAGLALALLFVKPNTAMLVPLALLVAGRYRLFATVVAVAAAVLVIAAVTMGTAGISAYISQLTGTLPSGADSLTLERALGVTGPIALALRVLIVAVSLIAAFRLRGSPGLVIAAGTLSSLLVAPYLHGSDLCLLGAAAWLVWEERPALVWRLPIAAGWLIASPFVFLSTVGPNLDRWPLIELALLVALVLEAWRPGRSREAALTGEAELRRPAPA